MMPIMISIDNNGVDNNDNNNGLDANQKDGNKEDIIEDPKDMTDNDNKDE